MLSPPARLLSEVPDYGFLGFDMDEFLNAFRHMDLLEKSSLTFFHLQANNETIQHQFFSFIPWTLV